MENKYLYQIQAANKVLQDALSNNYLASVLAVAPGGGKTTISHHIINKYLDIRPDAKVVVLTEGQNTLKNQYISELESPNVPINFTFGPFGSDAQVQVGIPQSISKLNWNRIDLLVVDEAHNFYLEPMVQDIVSSLKPTHKVLMTGSPTKYNAHNEKSVRKYSMYYISAEELQAKGVYSEVNIDVVKSDSKNAEKVINDSFSRAMSRGDSLEKIMIACSTIKFAKQVQSVLEKKGRVVSLSTSENDKDDAEINRFKSGQSDVLIVVAKGILGFNAPGITTLIDIRSSSNIDASFQLFARVLRKHPSKNIAKAYYRISNNCPKDYNKQVLTAHKMVALTERRIYTRYNGKNLKLSVV